MTGRPRKTPMKIPNESEESHNEEKNIESSETTTVFKTPARGKRTRKVFIFKEISLQIKEPTPKSVSSRKAKATTESPVESSSDAPKEIEATSSPLLRSSNENSETSTPPASQETASQKSKTFDSVIGVY